MTQKLCLAIALSLSLAASAQATPIIIVGNHVLQPNTPGQIIDINVSGGDAVQGLNFNAQVADGGPEVGGVIVGPSIKGHILPFGAPATTFNPLPTIFQPNNTGEQDVSGGLSQFLGLITTTGSGSVSANGLLARLEVDTTGFFGGTWDLLLSGTVNADTDFAGIPIGIQNGTLHIQYTAPEPSSFVLATLGILGGVALAVPRRLRRKG